MAKFSFKLESVKNVKEINERLAQRELAQIESYIQDHQLIKENLTKEVNSIRNNVRQKLPASELKFLYDYQSTLIKKIEFEDEELVKLDEMKKNKIQELIIKTKETKKLSRLEELHREDFNNNASKLESKMLDDIAVTNYKREKA